VLRVLVVDDDARVRTALSSVLGSHPDIALVACCADGATAIAVAESHGVDVVLLDVLLPDMTRGLDVLAAMTARGLAVVAMSVRGGLAPRSLEAGATRFVEKTGAIEDLLEAIQLR
jgi:CheY-like chemotaxis protein